MDLTTNYLGLSLRSPLVPSASPLPEKIDNVRAIEQAGSGRVSSLFEEQIEATAPEFRVDPNTYLENIAQARRAGENFRGARVRIRKVTKSLPAVRKT